MVDPTTSNILLAVPTRGSDTGTWDLPVNGNSTAIDGMFGGIQVISATNVPITLTSPAGVVTPTSGPSQSQNAVLRFTGTLTSNVLVTLPFPGYMIIENLTTGAFVLGFRAIGAGEQIGIEQGVVQHIYNDGTNVRFVNLPTVGSYMDICDSVVPAWILACSKPPWLDCNGTTFSAVTYPYLNIKLGGNTLPDFRGRSAHYLNEGTGRLTSGGAGIDGNTRFAAGGLNGVSLNTSNLPPYTPSGSFASTQTGIPLNAVVFPGQRTDGQAFGLVGPSGGTASITLGGVSGSITGNPQGGTSANITNAAPGIVSGLRLIRAA